MSDLLDEPPVGFEQTPDDGQPRRRRLAILLAIAVVAIGATVLVLAIRYRTPEDHRPLGDDPTTPEAGPDESPVELLPCELYFPGGGTWLRAEAAQIPPGDPEERARSLVEALLAGPQTPGLFAPLPAGVTVEHTYLTADRTIYVDLRAPEGAPPPALGSMAEMLAVYSLVDTVLLNLDDEASSVVLMWNGQQPPTFSGHLDTSRPLAPNTDLIAGPYGGS